MPTARTHGAPTGQVLVVTSVAGEAPGGARNTAPLRQKHDRDKLRRSKEDIKFDISVKENFGANRGGKRRLMYFICVLETVVRLQCRRRVCRCGSQASPPATCHIKSGDPGRLKRGVAQARETLAPWSSWSGLQVACPRPRVPHRWSQFQGPEKRESRPCSLEDAVLLVLGTRVPLEKEPLPGSAVLVHRRWRVKFSGL